jgi:large subunit ribosomal protein L6
MSRKARNPIVLPKGVEAKIDGAVVVVKGPKGTLQQEIRKEVKVAVKDGAIIVTLDERNSSAKNFLGLFWALISNMVLGVSQGFEKKLEMVGVGFRAAVQGNKLDLSIGFSHPTQLPIPEGIKVAVEKNNLLTVTGIDKQLVGQFAQVIRSKRPPEPYKGKGTRYADEYVRKKAGKAGKAAATK